MKKKRFTEEQISFALRQAEAGKPVAEICQQLGSSKGGFLLRKFLFAGSAPASRGSRSYLPHSRWILPDKNLHLPHTMRLHPSQPPRSHTPAAAACCGSAREQAAGGDGEQERGPSARVGFAFPCVESAIGH